LLSSSPRRYTLFSSGPKTRREMATLTVPPLTLSSRSSACARRADLPRATTR
jgi:hypothetical protein